MRVHDFAESLEKSKAHEDAEWWPKIYAQAFPNHMSAVSVRNDGWAQRGGIDRVVTLASGKTVSVDEKVRYQSYPDILLERWSSLEARRPGWAQKDLACDFIAYAFIPDRRCYLFSAPLLRMTWRKFGRQWCADAETCTGGFRVVNAKNVGYTTQSIAVPIPELLAAIHNSQVFEWAA